MNRPVVLPGFEDPNKRIILDHNKVKEVREHLRALGYKVSMTMGVFDLLHINHVEYLEDAQRRGDFLIVGIDSDDLTRKYKPDIKTRPLVPQEERMRMVARHAELVTLHEVNEDPNYLLKLIRPDVLIVSKSTKKFATKHEELEQWAGEVVVLEPKGEVSTTGRIRKLMIEGNLELINDLEAVFEKHRKKHEGG